MSDDATNPRSPKGLLSANGLTPKKSFGQNFLSDPALLKKLVALIAPASSVIEIGAGLGALTGVLLRSGHRVLAIERDRDLVPILRRQFDEFLADDRLRLLEADAKQVDYRQLYASLPRPRALMGNLPYNLTGPLLKTACGLAGELDQAVFLVQLEVAERLTAGPGTENYGALSIFCQAAFSVKRAFPVRRGAFYPQPNVDSAVVVLSPLARPTQETQWFQQLVRAAFAQRRKTLRNSWKALVGGTTMTLDEFGDAAGLDLSCRGETLDIAAFERAARVLERVS